MKFPTLLLLLSLALTWMPARAESFRSGDMEVVVNAMQATELTPQASEQYNVTRDPGRGVLTVQVSRNRGNTVEPMPAQIYAGALNQNNYLVNIPVRELRDQDGVHYLGEFRLADSRSLMFLVNVHAMGRQVKAEFSRNFPAP